MDRLEEAGVRAEALEATPDGVDVRPARAGGCPRVPRALGRGRRRGRVPADRARHGLPGAGPASVQAVVGVRGGERARGRRAPTSWGSIGLDRERHPATRHVATLGMAVTPAYRRRGVGSPCWRPACDGPASTGSRSSSCPSTPTTRRRSRCTGGSGSSRRAGSRGTSRTSRGVRGRDTDGRLDRGGRVSERVVQVGMLGCGTVGAAVVAAAPRPRRATSRRAPASASEVAKVAVRDLARDRDVPARPRRVHARRRRTIADDPGDRRRRRGPRRHRAGQAAAPARPRQRQARRHREQGAACERGP